VQLLGELLARLLFEQVAEGAGLQRGEEVVVVVMDGDHHRLHIGLLFAQGLHHLHAGAIGQAQVDQGHIKAHGVDQLQRIVDA
jgi:hypothetical protein